MCMTTHNVVFTYELLRFKPFVRLCPAVSVCVEAFEGGDRSGGV